jgi:pimeloyl-ACP methyl ester carboxylesterase
MRAYLICLLLSAFPAWVHAEIVQLQVRPGIHTSAEYLDGQRDKPAVLLLHGFLQTRDFLTVATLARGLHDAGYPVLSPTLSLNIPNRSQSLACEAIHRHSLDDDISEIAHWISWLKSHGHRSIVLIGHSFGSMQLLAYLDAKPDRAVKGYFGASLIETRIGNTVRAPLITQLKDQVQNGQKALVSQQISYCKKYLATPSDLLSYVRWDQPRTLAALKRSPVRMQLIMGKSDEMIGATWIKTLKQASVPMIVLPGANHFLDGEHEFDLLENALEFLTRVQQAPSR